MERQKRMWGDQPNMYFKTERKSNSWPHLCIKSPLQTHQYTTTENFVSVYNCIFKLLILTIKMWLFKEVTFNISIHSVDTALKIHNICVSACCESKKLRMVNILDIQKIFIATLYKKNTASMLTFLTQAFM